MFEKGNSVSSFPFKSERQVRIEGSLVGGVCVRGVMHAFARGLRVLPSRGIPLVRDLATKWVLRRAMRELHRLDDRTWPTSALREARSSRRYATGCPPANYASTIGTASGRSSGPPSPTSDGFRRSSGDADETMVELPS